MPNGYASMLLLGEGRETTEPYNKYDQTQPHSIRFLQFDQKFRLLSFRPQKCDLFTATHIKYPSDMSPFPLMPCGPYGNGSKEMGRIGLLCHGSNLHRFGIGSNGLGSTLKNTKFKGDNLLISTQVHSTQFDLSQFDLSYSTKRVDLILFDLFHSTHFMQSTVYSGPDNFVRVVKNKTANGTYNGSVHKLRKLFDVPQNDNH